MNKPCTPELLEAELNGLRPPGVAPRTVGLAKASSLVARASSGEPRGGRGTVQAPNYPQYERDKRNWIRDNPLAHPDDYTRAMSAIAKRNGI